MKIYPSTLPTIPRTGATIKQLPAFEIMQTSAGVSTVKRLLNNPPLQYTTKIKLIGNGQIAQFDDWYVKEILNGALKFNCVLALPVNLGGVAVECQFTTPPTFLEVGTHLHRIKEVSLSFYVYNPPHQKLSTVAGAYPNIPAPITRSVSETKTNMNISGVVKYGEQSSVGATQGADTYSLSLLLNYAEFSIFDGWWSNQQADGTKAFTAPLLTSQGLKDMVVRPLSGWSAQCNAGDVVVALEVELTRPVLTNSLELEVKNMGLSQADLSQINSLAIWKGLKNG